MNKESCCGERRSISAVDNSKRNDRLSVRNSVSTEKGNFAAGGNRGEMAVSHQLT
jgi:hypothetical protein